MNDDEYAFLDTNVLIYSVSNNVAKKQCAIELLDKKMSSFLHKSSANPLM
jgi:predicted nucleic acid-binding protein